MPKNDYVKLVIDARYLNSVTDLTNYSWPLEPVQMIMTRENGKFFSVSDLSCAYNQVPQLRDTEIDKLHHPWTTIYFRLRVLRSVWPTKLLQSPKDDSFWPTDQEKTGNYLHWRQHDAIANQKREVHHHQRISHPFSESWVKSCPRPDVFLPKESKVLGTRYLTRWGSTNSKACGRLKKPQITTE